MEPSNWSLRRCTIYTRKSSDEGLEQNFNSLHAQREARESFIQSQAGEGWRLVKVAYDDGGLSGATMERPGLLRLLADIREKRIEVVVVYASEGKMIRPSCGTLICSWGKPLSGWPRWKLPVRTRSKQLHFASFCDAARRSAYDAGPQLLPR